MQTPLQLAASGPRFSVYMKPNELEMGASYVNRRGREFRVLDRWGQTVRYQDQRGNVGDRDAKKFASEMVMKVRSAE